MGRKGFASHRIVFLFTFYSFFWNQGRRSDKQKLKWLILIQRKGNRKTERDEKERETEIDISSI